jgi:hypothetical protein
MMAIQILVVLFAIFAWTRVLARFRKATIGLGEFALWTGVWLVAIIGVLLPQTTQWLADLLGVGRGADAVFYVTIVVLFYIAFRLHLKIRGLEHQITDLVRKLALERQNRDPNP